MFNILKISFLGQFRQIKNSVVTSLGWIGTILLGFFVLLYIVSFFYVGNIIFASTKNIEASRLFVFNHFISYLFIIYLIKVLFNAFSVDKILLLLPIKKTQIINTALIKSFIPSFLGVFNSAVIIFVYYFLLIGNFFENIYVLFIMLSLLLCIHFVSIITKCFLDNIFILCINLIIIILGYYFYVQIELISSYILQNSVFSFFCLLLLVVSYTFCICALKGQFYEEQTQSINAVNSVSKRFSSYHLKWYLFTRNKRTRQTLIVTFMGILGYTYVIPDLQSKFSSYALVFLTSSSSLIIFGQYGLFNWQSNHFDKVLTSPDYTITIFRKEKEFYNFFTFIFTLASMLYVLNSEKFLLAFTYISAGLFTTGVSIYIILWVSLFSYSPMKLGKSAFMNYEGFNINLLVTIQILLFLPIALTYYFPIYGEMILIALGLIGIVFDKFWLRLLAQIFQKQKYYMAEGFRKN